MRINRSSSGASSAAPRTSLHAHASIGLGEGGGREFEIVHRRSQEFFSTKRLSEMSYCR